MTETEYELEHLNPGQDSDIYMADRDYTVNCRYEYESGYWLVLR